MVVERAIDVGFHLNFGTLMRSRYSKTPTRLAITDGFPFNPTYDSTREKRSRFGEGSLSHSLSTRLIAPTIFWMLHRASLR